MTLNAHAMKYSKLMPKWTITANDWSKLDLDHINTCQVNQA